MATSITGSGVATPQLSVSGQTTLGSTPNVTTPQSMVQLNTANGYGSTGTMIRRFTNVVTNQGADITYTDSAANGASFTINTSGVYAISYCDQMTGTVWLGISLNSNQLSTIISTINANNVLSAAVTPSANGGTVVSWIGYLVVGSVIRPHNSGGTTGTNPNACNFTITRVA